MWKQKASGKWEWVGGGGWVNGKPPAGGFNRKRAGKNATSHSAKIANSNEESELAEQLSRLWDSEDGVCKLKTHSAKFSSCECSSKHCIECDAPSSLVGDGSFDEGVLITPIDEGALCPLESAVQPPFHDASISTVEHRLRLLVGAASRNTSAFWSKATSAVRNNSYTLSCIAFAVLLAAVVVALVIPFLVSTSGATSFGVLHRAVESTPATSELISNTALVSVPRPPSTEVSMGLLKICCWVVASAFIFEPAWFWFIAFRLPQDTARAITYCLAAAPLAAFPLIYSKTLGLGRDNSFFIRTTKSINKLRTFGGPFSLLALLAISVSRLSPFQSVPPHGLVSAPAF